MTAPRAHAGGAPNVPPLGAPHSVSAAGLDRDQLSNSFIQAGNWNQKPGHYHVLVVLSYTALRDGQDQAHDVADALNAGNVGYENLRNYSRFNVVPHPDTIDAVGFSPGASGGPHVGYVHGDFCPYRVENYMAGHGLGCNCTSNRIKFGLLAKQFGAKPDRLTLAMSFPLALVGPRRRAPHRAASVGGAL